MTPSQRLPTLAAVLLLSAASCGGSGSPRPGATSSTSPPVPASSNTSPSTSPQTSPTRSVKAPPPALALKPLVVHIRGFAYVPAAPVVTVGQRIEIVNDDVAAHTWSAAPKAGWTYTSGNLEKGKRATYTGFSKPGSYRFLCYYHAEMPPMNGVVKVSAAP